MTAKEAVIWLINIMADIGKAEHRDLWHYEQALMEIREMLEADAQQWIPCKREQPTIDGKYNVTISGGVFGRYVTDLWYGKPTLPMNGAGGKRGWFETTPDGDYWYDGVIAWKPLEEPWKGEQP